MSFGHFGQPAATQPQTGAFGASTTAPLFGSFSQQQQNTQPATGIFGQQQQQAPAPGGGLFGSTQQNQPAGGGGGLFGQQQQQQPAGGGLFGNTTNQQQQPGTGLFGNNNNQQQQQAPATGGGLFGNQQPQQPAAGTTNLFGQPQQQPQQQTIGLFGNTTNNNGQAPAGGLFGANAAGTVGGGGLFGNQNKPTTSLFGNFGQTQPQQQPAQNGGLFGSTLQQAPPPPQQHQQPQAGGGLFGSTLQPAGGGLFGASTSNQNQNQQQANGALGGMFGPKATTIGGGPFSGSMLDNGQQLQQQAGSAGAVNAAGAAGAAGTSILERVQEVYNAWDPSSPSCRFQHYFYNEVDPQQVGYYGRPVNATNEAAWQKALRDNPDPSCMVAVPAIGFEDLKKRADAQSRTAAEQQAQLAELSKRLDTLSQKHSVSSSLRTQKASLSQTHLNQRIAAQIQHLHLLIPSVRSSSIRPEEEALRAALESVEDELKRSGGLGRMKGKLSELWTAVSALKAMRERAMRAGGAGGADGRTVEWAVVDESGLNELTEVLYNEQQGLAHVLGVLKGDIADVEVIETGMASGGAQTGGSLPAGRRHSALSPNRTGGLSASMLGARS